MSLIINNSNINIQNKKEEINTIKKDSKDLNFDKIEKVRDKMRIFLNNKYGNKNNLKYQYIGLIMHNLIFNKGSHLVSVFKDYMIVDYIEEFLKRYYKINESHYKLPQFSLFYKNYLKFFCEPTIKHFFFNNLIHNRLEKKAEFFYKENYKNKKNSEKFTDQDIGLCEDSSSSEEEEENEESTNKKIQKNNFFDDKIVKKIENNTPFNTSMALPESGSKLKKNDSGLLESNSNEESLVKIMHGICKDNIYNNPIINSKANKNQTLESKKSEKKINNIIDFLSNDNGKKKKINSNNSDKKSKNEKNNKNKNIDNSNNKNNNFKKFIRPNTLKKIGTQKIKILLNKNNGILKSKSNKKIIRKKGLWNLLKEKESMNIKSHDNDKTNNDINDLSNKENLINVNKIIKKNSNISYMNLSKNKSVKKIINKLSPYNNNPNSIQNKKKNSQKNYITNNLTNNSNYATFEKNGIKKKSYNYFALSKNQINIKNNCKNYNKNLINSILNKIKYNEIKSIKNRTLNRNKILLNKQNKSKINLTRNNNKIFLYGLTNNYLYSNNSKLNITNSNKINKNYSSNNELRPKSNNVKNLKFFNSPSSILDFLKINKIQNKYKKSVNQSSNNKSNHIHNVNININNQINIKFNYLKDLASFIGNNKKNKIKKSIISRNKNRSLDFNTINQNIIINNNYSTFFSNYNKKKKSIKIIKNNKIYEFKNKNSNSRNNKINNNIESQNSHTKDRKIKGKYH